MFYRMFHRTPTDFPHHPKQLHAVPHPACQPATQLDLKHHSSPFSTGRHSLAPTDLSMLTADLAEPKSTIPLTAAPHGIPASTAAIRVPTGGKEHAGSYRFPGLSHHAISASTAAI
jgi:hypothetical protein